MWKDEDREFAGTQNVWIKRIGLFILCVGLFPGIAIQYWTELEFVWKWLLILAAASYVFYHFRGLLKSVFGSKS